MIGSSGTGSAARGRLGWTRARQGQARPGNDGDSSGTGQLSSQRGSGCEAGSSQSTQVAMATRYLGDGLREEAPLSRRLAFDTHVSPSVLVAVPTLNGLSHIERGRIGRRGAGSRAVRSNRPSQISIVTTPPAAAPTTPPLSSTKPDLNRKSDSYTDPLPNRDQTETTAPLPFNPPPCLTLSVRARARATCSSATLSRRA